MNLTGEKSKDFDSRFLENISHRGSELIKTVLKDYYLPLGLINNVLKRSGVGNDTSCSNLSKIKRKRLLSNLREYSFLVESTQPLEKAMLTVGGIELGEIDPRTMESRMKKNCFFAGEILDINGSSGGYNIQAAFSTGWVAGKNLLL